MGIIRIRGGKRLTGEVKISGAKNAVLPIIAASILGSNEESVICDVPHLDDVITIQEVIKELGAVVQYEQDTIKIRAEEIKSWEAPVEWVRKMRASFLVMGPLLARMGRARIALPGGCAIGTRPIDQHLKGLEAMGAEFDFGQGFIEGRVAGGRLHGAKIYLDVPSVGATENIMMAATLADGITTIENAAKEPEIVDLANYLNSMGAKVRGAGTGVIRIEGVAELQGAKHQVIPDRIEAGTYMIAAAITGGNVYLNGAIADHLRAIIAKLQEMGATVTEDETGVRVIADSPLKSVHVKTLPYPGFPTDLQAQMMALLLVSEGTGLVTETVFENRFMHVEQFQRMNAEIRVEGRTAIVPGGQKLQGARVCATDLRAGAALVIAALAAEGETEVEGLEHMDRGYADLHRKLAGIGAEVERLDGDKASEEEALEEAAARKDYPLAVQPSMA